MRFQRWGDVEPTAAPAPPPVGLLLRSARSASARLVWLGVRLVPVARGVLGLPARRAPLLARLGLARLAASLGRPDRRARLGLARKLPSVGRPDLESIEGMLVLAPPIAFEL
ncbi:hypothetical protein QHF84_50010 [Polyangium sp. y55x31]|nr:hypothetical protein [Polyangium sp. y55x31]